jgi:HPt (histidine-containing phosphotransfer) domain-containing protein
MSSPRQDFEQFLEQQRADYQRVLPEKVGQLQVLWRAAAAGAEAAQPLAELERLAHTLAGTAGTFGFRELGLAAKALELLLQPQAGPLLTPTRRSEIAQAIATLQASLPADQGLPPKPGFATP